MEKNNQSRISALVLAKDEEDRIADCLSQLNFVDEIIVLDQNSQDKTVEIAKRFKAIILNSQDENFANNRNILANKATNDWLLYVDADERLSKELVGEILSAIKNQKYSAYYVPRKNKILGTWLKHGGWWPDYVPKVFEKSKLLNWSGSIHESPHVSGDFGYLKHPLIHITAPNFNHMFIKTIKWAKIEAELNYQANSPKVNSAKVLFSFFKEFGKRYFIKLGFLDGKVGLIESLYQAYHRAIVLVYLWELQNNTFEKYKKADV